MVYSKIFSKWGGRIGFIILPDERHMFEAMRGLDVGENKIQAMLGEVQQRM